MAASGSGPSALVNPPQRHLSISSSTTAQSSPLDISQQHQLQNLQAAHYSQPSPPHRQYAPISPPLPRNSSSSSVGTAAPVYDTSGFVGYPQHHGMRNGSFSSSVPVTSDGRVGGDTGGSGANLLSRTGIEGSSFTSANSGSVTIQGPSASAAAGENGGANDPHGVTGSTSQALMQQAQISKPIRRRMRMITSCLECRRRKLKCNKSQPCTNCLKFSRDCHYLGPKLDEASQLKLTEIKEKVGSLERQLERDVAKTSPSAFGGPGTGRGSQYQQRILADDVEDGFDSDRDLEITPLVALDLTYEDDADGTDDIIDLGIQVGRMRITERIGGLNRPRISEEIQTGLTVGQMAIGYGSAWSPNDSMSDVSEATFPDFLKPSQSYIPPTSGVFFGQVFQSPQLISLLPSKNGGDCLMRRYFKAVHPVALCVHKPSLEYEYNLFWEDILKNYEPRASIQAVIFAAWFSAAVSMDDVQANQEFGMSKSQLVENMKIGVEAALSKANFLRTTRFETIQAFVMYMLPLCRAEVSRAHSVLVGAAIRMAECMGLHRDGEAYGLNPLETHVRRLVWHQLCFLDIRTCEAQGPRPAIRREEYDTKLPLNCEEDQLSMHPTIQVEAVQHWTSTLLSLVRFEINEMMRIIWSDRRKLETRKVTLTSVLTKIENFRKGMLDKYDHYLDDNIPIHLYTKLVMHLLMWRLHAMLLHPYHTNTATPMPPRLANLLIISGVWIIEISMRLESDPRFRDWSWYVGAYQQFQIALLLATELYYRPDNKEADRIWRCLDYVFNLDYETPRDHKSMQILSEIMTKTSVYTRTRKMRAPTTISKAVPEKQAIRQDSGHSPSTAVPGSHYHSSGPPILGPAQVPGPGMKIEPGISRAHGNNMMTSQSSGPSSMPAMSAMGRGPPPPNTAQQHPNLSPRTAFPGPLPNVVFAGVSNGEALWSLPPGNPDSPENSSDAGSVTGHTAQRHGSNAGLYNNTATAQANVMADIDWDAFNALFPQNPQTGEIEFSYMEPVGMRWSSH